MKEKSNDWYAGVIPGFSESMAFPRMLISG